MKRTFALALTAALILSLAACSKQETSSPAQESVTNSDISIGGENVQIVSPWTEHDTLADLNATTGFEFTAPDNADGLPISCMQEMGELAEVVYPSESTLDVDGVSVVTKGSGEGISLAVWSSGGMSYSLGVSEELTTEQVTEFVRAINE